MMLKDQLSAIKRKGPEAASEFDPAVEAEMEEGMPEEELGVEEFSAEESLGGGVEAVIAMLDDLSPEELSEVQAELDMRLGEGSEEMDEGMDYEEDMGEEEELV